MRKCANIHDAGAALRTNTDLAHRDGFLALRYVAGNDAWATLATSSFVAERGIPGELHSASPRHWRYPHVSRTVAVVSGGTGNHDTPFGGRGDIEASVAIDAGRTEIVAYSSDTFSEPIDSEDGDDVTLTIRLLGDHTLGERGDLSGAFTYADIRHDELLSGTQSSAYRQRIWSLGAETGWSIDVGGILPSLRLSVGAAVDGADTPESGDKPALDRMTDWAGSRRTRACARSG